VKPKSLSQRVAKGGMWVFALRVLEKSLRLVRLIIVARLLAPNDFGLFGIALLAMSTFETFSQMGFQTALVQKEGDIVPYLDNTWTVSIIRGTLLFIILFITAPYIALFFKAPEASLIIRVVGATLCVGGFVNSGIVYFQRELEFNKQFLYRLATTLADFIVVVVAAVVWKNVWALVVGLLAGSLAGLVASYLIHPYRPHFRLDLDKTKELFGYGKWVFGSTVLVFLITQGDDAFVGKVLGAAMLGFYQTEITHVISQVTFPAYAKMQDNLPRLREAYVRVLQLTAFLSFPIAGLIFALAPDFTKLFLGERWMPMVPAMQVLACAGLARSIAATTGPLFYASGRPKVDTRWQIIRLLTMALLIYPCTIQWGILGTSIVVLVSMVVSTIGFSYQAIKITGYTLKIFSKAVLFPLLNGTIVVVTLFFLKNNFAIDGVLGFFALIGTGVIMYLGLSYLSDRSLTYNVQSLVKGGFNSLLGR
jgi:lipopolysaccharide exporter